MMYHLSALLQWLLLLATSTWAESTACSQEEAFAQRAYFYAGGTIVNATVSNVTDEFLVGQIYVERLTPPIVRHEFPLIFVHGVAQTATNFLNTPDGRRGWASYFLEQGYVVYLTDNAQRGRSTWLPGNGQISAFPRKTLSSLFTAPEKVQPFPYPQAILHTQWPGTGLPGDSIFDAFEATQVAYQANATLQAIYTNQSFVALIDSLPTPAFVITHSQAGPYGWQLGDARPDRVAGLVAIEPGATPFKTWTGPPYAPGYFPDFAPNAYGITAIPLTFDPPLPGNNASAITQQSFPPSAPDRAPCIRQAEPARKLPNLARVPILMWTGEASYQAVYGECVAAFLQQAGVNVNYTRLADVGIRGNGHFSFLEKNSDEVAERMVVPFLAGHERESMNYTLQS